MPEQEITLSVSKAIQGLKDIPRPSSLPPVAFPLPDPWDGWRGALDALEAAASGAGLSNQSFTIALPQWVSQLLAAKEALENKVGELQSLLGTQPGTSPASAAPPALAPVDPLTPLQRLADAINAAEKRLNQQNLVIASGNVEVSLSVKVGDVAGAHATVKLDVQPRPMA